MSAVPPPDPRTAGPESRPDVRCRTAPAATLHARPDAHAETVSECLFGERVDVLGRHGDWARVRNRRDGYEGHVQADALGDAPDAELPVHLVGVRATLLFAAPDLKSPVLARLPLGAELALAEVGDDTPFARVIGGAGGGDGGGDDDDGDRARDGTSDGGRGTAPADAFVWRAHCLAPGARLDGAPVDVARRLFDGAPYRWGGRTPDGADCSGLVQGTAFALGIRLPRDSGEQEAALEPVPSPDARTASDLVFWPGHVAWLLDADTVFHATAHVLATAVEPLADVVARAGPPSSVRRLPRPGRDRNRW